MIYGSREAGGRVKVMLELGASAVAECFAPRATHH